MATAKTATSNAKVQANVQEALNQGQTYMQEGFDAWVNVYNNYTKLFMNSAQVMIDQSLATRETFNGMMADSMKKSQALSAKEQEMFLSNLDIYTAQTKAYYDKVGQIFTPAK